MILAVPGNNHLPHTHPLQGPLLPQPPPSHLPKGSTRDEGSRSRNGEMSVKSRKEATVWGEPVSPSLALNLLQDWPRGHDSTTHPYWPEDVGKSLYPNLHFVVILSLGVYCNKESRIGRLRNPRQGSWGHSGLAIGL